MKVFKLSINALVALFFICPVFSQEITNIVSKQQGDQVVITYDLTAPANSNYYIKVYLQKNGNLSNGKELMYVSGDVKDTKPGTAKRIVWDAKKEVGHYNGEVQFKIEALNRTARMPNPIVDECVKIEITDVDNDNGSLKISFIVEAIKTDCSVKFKSNYSYVVDSEGNSFAQKGQVIGKVVDDYKFCVLGVKNKGYAMFQGVGPSETILPEVTFTVYTSGDCRTSNSSCVFRNVPIVE